MAIQVIPSEMVRWLSFFLADRAHWIEQGIDLGDKWIMLGPPSPAQIQNFPAVVANFRIGWLNGSGRPRIHGFALVNKNGVGLKYSPWSAKFQADMLNFGFVELTPESQDQLEKLAVQLYMARRPQMLELWRGIRDGELKDETTESAPHFYHHEWESCTNIIDPVVWHHLMVGLLIGE